MQDERRKPECVVTVEMRQEDGLDAAGIDPEAVHVGEQGRASIEQHPAVHHHRPVVAVERESRSATEERELYAMVTAGFR